MKRLVPLPLLFAGLALVITLILWLVAWFFWTQMANRANSIELAAINRANAELTAQIEALLPATASDVCRAGDALFDASDVTTALPPADQRIADYVAPVGAIPAGDRSLDQTLSLATVLILAGDSLSEVQSTGSGFFVAPDLVMTNAHVTDGFARIFVANGTNAVPTEGQVIAQQRDGEQVSDFALVRLASPVADAVSMPLAKVQRMQRVFASGYPGFFINKQLEGYMDAIGAGQSAVPPQGIVTDGVITSVQATENATILPHTAPLSPGNSGGPLVDACGRVVGINTYVMQSDEGNVTTRGDFALGSAGIVDFLSRNGVPAKLASTPCATAEVAN